MRIGIIGIVTVLACLAVGMRAQEAPLTPTGLKAALEAKPTGADAAKLAERVRAMFGGAENLKKGPNVKVEGLTVAAAIEAPGAVTPPKVVMDDTHVSHPMIRLGDTDVYALAGDVTDG